MSNELYLGVLERFPNLNLAPFGSELVSTVGNFDILLRHHIEQGVVRDIDGLFEALEVMSINISADERELLEERGIFIDSHIREVNPNKVSWCVDERLVRSRYFSVSDPKPSFGDPISVHLPGVSSDAVVIKEVPFELSILSEKIPSTPFPGGKVGFYGATALAEILDLESDTIEPDWWAEESGLPFIQTFLRHIVQKTHANLAGTSFEKTPVHIDDHGGIEDDKELIEGGLGCGYSLVFLNVLFRQLSLTNPGLAMEFAQKLGQQFIANDKGDLEYVEVPDSEQSIPRFVAKSLIHSAIASGSAVYILTGSHDADGIIYSLSDFTVDAMVVGADSQAVDRVTGSNVTLFESTMTWLKRRAGDPVYDLLTDRFFGGNSNRTQFFGLTVNNSTYDLLGQSGKPLYCVPGDFQPSTREPLANA